jgi:hypothetical protein
MAKRGREGIEQLQDTEKKQRTGMDNFRIVNQPACLFPDHRGGHCDVLFDRACGKHHWICMPCVISLLRKNFEVSGMQTQADKCPELTMSFTSEMIPCARCFSGISHEGKETRSTVDVGPDLKFITPMCAQVGWLCQESHVFRIISNLVQNSRAHCLMSIFSCSKYTMTGVVVTSVPPPT